MERGSGILLPIFSLPSPYGIGTFGKDAYKFIDFLQKSGQKYWQLLPLNPTSYGDSPYQSFSAFALNPYFIDLEFLERSSYLSAADLAPLDRPYDRTIDYGFQYGNRLTVLRTACTRSLVELKDKIRGFGARNPWVRDYAAFMVLKGLNGGRSWQEWPSDQQEYSKSLCQSLAEEHPREYEFWLWTQYVASRQYKSLKRYAGAHGVKIVGDIPIYVALDSADVWANQRYFQLDDRHRPLKVAGVPPDYFSATGQLWGNPLYDYERMAADGYRWWKKRIELCRTLFDVLRIDHFRGMEAYWAIPYGEETAINGAWIKGPGMELVEAITKAARGMDIIAEDLGFLTPEVLELKAQAGWPGLKIYQFGFDSDGTFSNSYLPTNFETDNCVAYIGTHDNDTLRHFIETKPELVPAMERYLCVDGAENIHDTMIGTLFRSRADVIVLTMQDLLKEGGEYRFNTPGTLGANWVYRLPKAALTAQLSAHLLALTRESGR